MKFVLDVTMQQNERALDRLVNLIGRREYRILDMRVDGTSRDGLYLVRCSIESARRAEILVRFVEKLYDVETARWELFDSNAHSLLVEVMPLAP